jgi:hypothetical protein
MRTASRLDIDDSADHVVEEMLTVGQDDFHALEKSTTDSHPPCLLLHGRTARRLTSPLPPLP